MPGTVLRVQGVRDLRRDLKAMGDDLSDLKDANAAAAALVAAAAAARAPRRTGRLAASVRPNRALGRARVSAGTARVPDAGPIHFGWPARGIEANPFVYEAARVTQHLWVAAYERAVSKAVDKVAGKTY